MTRLFIIALALFVTLPISSSLAEDEPVLVVENNDTPVQKWIAAENALIEPLSKKDQETFFVLRNKHSVIRTLRIVRDDIKSAVNLCAKDNETLTDEIKTRFSEWEDAVVPILDEADDFLKEEVNKQAVVSPSEARKVFKLNDKAYKFSQSKIKKQPISDEKSCRGLIKSMDKTEDELIALLQIMLLPEEVLKMRLAKQKEQEKAQEDKNKK